MTLSDAVEGGVAVEAPWGGTAMYNEDENGVVLLDDDLEDDRAATSGGLHFLHYLHWTHS